MGESNMAANAQLMRREDSAITVTNEQLEIVKKTIAQGATDAELKLFLYDCQRQGVHPLDRLLHFTKRGGKYTPITSIDLMRSRAAETGEYAGNEDAAFNGLPKSEDFTASVTLYRLVQGQRCSFTATAYWSEYCPSQGQDHMWKKMPHTMLAKCAEALALRKAFPKQLAGLYAREEMDQAGPVQTAEFVETEARQIEAGAQQMGSEDKWLCGQQLQKQALDMELAASEKEGKPVSSYRAKFKAQKGYDIWQAQAAEVETYVKWLTDKAVPF
jgi:phage recombination protein Bet